MKVFKILAILFVFIVLIVVGAAAFGLSRLDALAKQVIEQGATHVLDVKTTLRKADVQLTKSAFAMEGLNVANPSGYKTPHFLALGSGGVSLNPQSLKTKLIELPTLTLADLDVNLEKSGGKANYQQILDNMKRFESSGSSAPSSSSESEYKFVIRRLEIKNISAHANLIPLVGDKAVVDVVVPEIVLTDVGTGGKPLDMSALVNLITKSVLSSIISVGGSQLPTEILDGLQAGIGSLSSLGDVGTQILDQSGQVIGNLQGTVSGLQKGLDDAAKGVQEGADNLKKEADKIGGTVKDLLGGKSK